MKRLATALSLAVTLLAGPALAEEPAGTPLVLRPNAPAPLESKGGMSWGYKVVALVAVAGAAALWFRRKRSGARPSLDHEIRVVTRASLGPRQELVVVEVLGQRMLLGVTATSIHQLADLDEPPRPAEEPEEERAPVSAPRPALGERLSALVDGARPAGIEGQARGLLALAKKR